MVKTLIFSLMWTQNTLRAPCIEYLDDLKKARGLERGEIEHVRLNKPFADVVRCQSVAQGGLAGGGEIGDIVPLWEASKRA